jgi:transposase
MIKTLRMYPNELREQVVNMVLNGKRIVEVSKDLDIPSSTIDGWIRRSKKKNSDTNSTENVNITQLLKELRDTKEERDILKKALAIFSKHPEKNTGL